MIGSVRQLHALLNVVIVREFEPPIQIEFVVDSGFTGHLCLSEEAVELLGLEFDDIIEAKLANDSMVRVRVYEATIIWGEEERVVRVLATGDRPLLGTALLAGSSLYAEFIEHGVLEVKPLDSPREARDS